MSISEAIQSSALFRSDKGWIAPQMAAELGIGEAIVSQTMSCMVEREIVEKIGKKRVNGIQGQAPKYFGVYRRVGAGRLLKKTLVNWWPEQDGIDARQWAR